MPEVIGVVGAGTMGAGIAQLAAAAGARTLLHDPVAEARERGLAQIADGLERWRAKGRLEREPGEVAEARRARRAGRGGARHRGGARAPRAQARALRHAEPDRPGRRAGLQHLLDPDHGDRQRGGRPRARRRHALLQPRARHGPRRDHRGHRLLARGARRRARHRPGDGQAGHRRRRRARLPGQPLQPALWPGGPQASAGARRPTSRRSTRSSAPPGFAWARSSCRTWSGSTSATRSRSPSTS